MITPAVLVDMRRNFTDGATAIALDHRARTIEVTLSNLFVEVGVIAKEVDDRELWRHITKTDGDLCHSFDDWLLDAMPVSRGTVYAARKVAQRLSGIPVEERSLISPGNLKTLAEVDDPKITQDRLILDASKKLKPAAFREKIMREHPEQHLEAESPMKFTPTTSQRREIEEALVLAVALGDAGSRNEALEAIAVHYKQTRPNEAEIEETVIPGRVQ
jgi:hypothetical protein